MVLSSSSVGRHITEAALATRRLHFSRPLSRPFSGGYLLFASIHLSDNMAYEEIVDDAELSAFDELPDRLTMSTADLLNTYETVNVLAPLVRCSKLPFRHLTSLYETHVTHTPMILAQEFSRSQTARMSDFSTSATERGVFWMQPQHAGSTPTFKPHPEDADQPQKNGESSRAPRRRLPPTAKPPTKQSQLVRGNLVAQFASPNGECLADAAELIRPYVDGIDINCGCPQKWAYNEGIGCALLRKPELVRDMVRAVKARLGDEFPVSIKIRVDPDLK